MHSIKTALSRYGWFTAGVLLNAFGVALITKAALGTSPISSLPYVLSLRFPVTLGQFTFLMNMLFILAQVLLLRKDFRPVQLLQVAVNVVFSLFIDVSMGLLSWMEVGVLPMRLLALAVGLALAGGLVEWPFTLVRVVAFYPFYAFGVLFRPQLDALAAAAAEKCSLRRAALAALLVGYGAYFLRVLLADPILDNSPQLFHDVSYAGGDTVGYRVVFYLAGILTTAALAVVFSSRHQLEGLGRHTLAIYLLHMPILAALIEFKFYDLMRGKPLAVVVLWFTLLACATLALLNWQPVQTAFDKLANCWYKRK